MQWKNKMYDKNHKNLDLILSLHKKHLVLCKPCLLYFVDTTQ